MTTTLDERKMRITTTIADRKRRLDEEPAFLREPDDWIYLAGGQLPPREVAEQKQQEVEFRMPSVKDDRLSEARIAALTKQGHISEAKDLMLGVWLRKCWLHAPSWICQQTEDLLKRRGS